MAQIITYPKLSTLSNKDLLLVSDVSSKNKTTNSLEVDTLAQYIITTNSVIKGGGTIDTVPIFTGPNTIGDSIITYNSAGGAGNDFMSIGGTNVGNNGGSGFVSTVSIVGIDLFITNISASGSGTVTLSGDVVIGDDASDSVKILSQVRDSNNNISTAVGQVLSSTATGQLVWTSDGGGTVTGTGVTNSLPIWTDGLAGVLGTSAISETTTEIFVDNNFEIGGIARFPATVNIDNATSNSSGIIFNHPAGGASGVVNMYYAGAAAGSRFVISRAATGGAEIELQANGDINLNRLGNGKVLFGSDADMDSNQIKNVATPVNVNDAATKAYVDASVQNAPFLMNGLVNNLASAGSGGYDFMEWVSNVTGSTQIPVIKLPFDITLRSVTYSWMGDTALSIGAGEQVAFTIGIIPSGANPVIANYTAQKALFTLDNTDDGTYANDIVSGIDESFGGGDVIAVVGTETGTVTPNSGELSLCFHWTVD